MPFINLFVKVYIPPLLDLKAFPKTDLAPYVGVDLEFMQSDVKDNRKNKPSIFISNKDENSLNQVVAWVEVLIK